MNATSQIAVFGLGAMGLPIAMHLRSSGNTVVGIDVDPNARKKFPGAISPELADLAEINCVITMLPEGAHVLDAYKQIILPQASKDTVLIDCSTIDVNSAVTVNQLAIVKDLPQVDAPVSGGPPAAGSGELSLMIGGRDPDIDKAMPYLQLIGTKITKFGKPGSGQAAKACHNMICGITAMAVMEGFALAEALELDPRQFYDLCASAAAQSWTLENRCPVPGVAPDSPASNGYAPGFAARLMAKDLGLAQEAAAASGQPTPFGASAAASFAAFAHDSGGHLDFSSYYRSLRPDVQAND